MLLYERDSEGVVHSRVISCRPVGLNLQIKSQGIRVYRTLGENTAWSHGEKSACFKDDEDQRALGS